MTPAEQLIEALEKYPPESTMISKRDDTWILTIHYSYVSARAIRLEPNTLSIAAIFAAYAACWFSQRDPEAARAFQSIFNDAILGEGEK